MAVFKSLTFDGINSLNYGIYVTGEAVYNAPERVVEMVNIPGRNGALAIDQGYFENIEVSYPCGCFADTQAEFASKVSAFRNAIASRYSYKRLTDEYNADEYRLALYKSGLEVSAVNYGTAGQFTITFNCKPQRFLLDGDAELSPTDYSDVHTVSGDIVQIDNDGTLGVKSVLTTIEPIQSGSGTPSPDNVRPISGHTECVTSVAGKNLLKTNDNLSWIPSLTKNADGSIKVVGSRTSNGAYAIGTVSLKANNTYVMKASGSADLYFQMLNASSSTVAVAGLNDGTYTPTSDETVTIRIFARANITFDTTIYPQLELGTTATAYEPYNGNTYTTSLGRTVYGGSLDVVSGVLTVDRAIVTFDGSEDWKKSSSGNVYYLTLNTSTFPYGKSVVQHNVCDKYVFKGFTGGGYASFLSDGEYLLYDYPSINVTREAAFKNESITSVADWRASLQSNPLQLVYELATPQTYQLTPTEVQTLLGTNNVWTDCGEISVEYGIPPYYNPTEFDAKPLIKVTGRGTLGIGEYILTITGTVTQTLYIDCETMEIYTLEGTVPTGASSLVSINKTDFPVLKSGHNGVSVGTGLSALTITPRWWRI